MHQSVAKRLLPSVGVPAAPMDQEFVPLWAAQRPDQIRGFIGVQTGSEQARSGQSRTDEGLGFESGAVDTLRFCLELGIAGLVQEQEYVAEALVGEARDRAHGMQ